MPGAARASGGELVVLGSGHAFADAERGQAGYLLRNGATAVLVDVGPGTLGRLCRAGFGPERVESVFVTHWHPDHVSDLVPLLFNLKHAPIPRERDVVVHGPPGFGAVFDVVMTVFGQWCVGETYEVLVREVERERVEVGSLAVTAFPVRHPVPSVGYRVEVGGASVALTGDTGPYEGLVELARGADVLVCDATLPPGTSHDGHLSARQAGELAAAAGVRTLVLSHLSPESAGADPSGEARRAFGGEVQVATDLLRVVL